MPETPAPLPDPQTAANFLTGQVYARTFFQKLATAGFAPINEQQAEQYMQMAGKLRTLADDPRVKSAALEGDPVATANKAVDALMDRYGIGKSAAVQEQAVATRQQAIRFAQDPSVYNATLSLKAAEAQIIQNQRNGNGQSNGNGQGAGRAA